MTCIKANATLPSAASICNQGFRGNPEGYKDVPAGVLAGARFYQANGNMFLTLYSENTQIYPLGESPKFTAESEVEMILTTHVNFQLTLWVGVSSEAEMDPDLEA